MAAPFLTIDRNGDPVALPTAASVVEAIEAAADTTQAVSATAMPLPAGAATEASLAALVPLLDGLEALAAATTSADRVFAITPSDSATLATIPKALLVTIAGNLALRGTDTAPVTIPVTVGQVVPIRARYVNATGTTATVVGLA